MSLSTLSIFIPTFLLVSLTPGLCMTLSLSLGMTVGVARAGWMMIGELIGVGTVAVASVVGVASVLMQAPGVFTVFKWVGGAYLVWLGIEMWRSRGNLAIPEVADDGPAPARSRLALQGLVTAIANPKGWAFFIALLPPFIHFDEPLAGQLVLLLAMILSIEALCLLLYASGGQAARRLLEQRANVLLLNRIAGSLIMGVGAWLALG